MMRRNNIFGTACLLALYGTLLWGCGYDGREETVLIGAGEICVPESAETEGAEGSLWPLGDPPQEERIRVYVCGAVANPGVVEVAQGSRAEDALLAAGGFAEDAGREAVNLADWITDGQMLYFPTKEEARQAGTKTAQGLVNINTADAAQLCTLPGIGESRAADIIAYRERNGGFDSCEDIMKVPGIKTSVYEKIRDKIRAD